MSIFHHRELHFSLPNYRRFLLRVSWRTSSRSFYIIYIDSLAASCRLYTFAIPRLKFGRNKDLTRLNLRGFKILLKKKKK